jgi:corrinoid protein of di/trimethylamine methyltransferase
MIMNPESANENLFARLSDAVVNMDEMETIRLAGEFLNSGGDPAQAIELGLVDGMRRAGDLFEREEYFIPELLICSEAMYAGLRVLEPHLPRGAAERKKGKVVLGVVEGDTHDIGKNLVKIMLETAGFDVVDLGRDVAPAVFVERATAVNADIIGLSTLMTTTMSAMSEVIRLLDERKARPRIKVIVGGGPVSQQFANRIGADGYASNASTAVALARRLREGTAEVATP